PHRSRHADLARARLCPHARRRRDDQTRAPTRRVAAGREGNGTVSSPLQADPPQVIRCGVSKLLIWMGLALVVVGVLLGIGGVIWAVLSGDMSLLAGLILTAIFGTAGLLMHVCGKRCRVEVTVRGDHWAPLAGHA